MRAAARALVIVFARAPLAGQAKTRLAPRLGAAGAARLQARLAFAALHTAREARCGPVELHLTARHSLFAGKARLRVQRGADLGARMHHALVHGLRRHGAAILIGADCPALRPEDLRRAARLSIAPAAHRLGRRPARGPRAPQIAPLRLSASAMRSAMMR
jgi:hypothetical protein